MSVWGDGERSCFQLGDWLVRPDRNQLCGETQDRRLRRLEMDLLVRLVQAKGEVVSKQDLLDDVWQGKAVVEHVLPKTVSALRTALGDSSRAPRYIETVPKRGYRVVAPIATALSRGESPERITSAPRWSSRWLAAACLASAVAGGFVAKAWPPASEELPVEYKFAVAVDVPTRHEILIKQKIDPKFEQKVGGLQPGT